MSLAEITRTLKTDFFIDCGANCPVTTTSLMEAVAIVSFFSFCEKDFNTSKNGINLIIFIILN
jgi:hypothetical protein